MAIARQVLAPVDLRGIDHQHRDVAMFAARRCRLVDHAAGLEEYRRYGWQRQLHIYEVPFYYIEYGIAQLGAIGLWKQYKENPERAVNNYIKALKVGGTRKLPELFNLAGLDFNFSPDYIKGLMGFVREEMGNL